MFKNVLFIILLIVCSHALSFRLRDSDDLNDDSNMSLDMSEEKKEKPKDTQMQTCECPAKETVYSQIGKADFDQREIKNKEPMEEIIDQVNYGLPSVYEEYQILKKDFIVTSSFTDKIEGCPKGYRPLDQDDIKKMETKLGEKAFEVFTDPNLFNFSADKNYILNTKVTKFLSDSADSKSFEFRGASFNIVKKSIAYLNLSTYFEKSLLYKCVLDLASYSLNISVKGEGVLENKVTLEKKTNLAITNTNLKFTIWKLFNQVAYGDIANATFKKEGCSYIYAWGLLLNNQVAYGCFPVYVQVEKNSSVDSDLEKSQLKSKTFDKNALRQDGIHFAHNSSPFTYNLKNQVIIAYTNKSTYDLHLFVLDENLNELKDANLEIKAIAVDITRIPSGVVILCRDYNNSSHLYMYAVNEEFIQMWKRDIVNNPVLPDVGHIPDEKTNVIFRDKDKKVEFGMNNMFNVLAGKILLGGGRIAVLFSHSNNFGLDDQGNRKDHVGSSLLTFDEKGQNEALAFSWAASPTLELDLDTDGVNFITSSLSGAFPDNIQICTVAITNFLTDADHNGNVYKHKVHCKNLLEDGIFADGKGGSCGRMGSLVNDQSQTYGIAYSVRSCKGNQYDQEKEFSFLLFDGNLKIKTFTQLGNHDNINCIKSAKFGKNIIISYTISNDKDIDNKNVLDPTLREHDETFIMLVDFEGKIINQPEKIPLSFCEEINTLNDGSIGWTDVGRSKPDITYFAFKSVK